MHSQSIAGLTFQNCSDRRCCPSVRDQTKDLLSRCRKTIEISHSPGFFTHPFQIGLFFHLYSTLGAKAELLL